MSFQHTLSQEISVSGVGLHSGLGVNLRLKPAGVDHGVRFRRTDIFGQCSDIFATVGRVTSLARATTLANAAGQSVSTVEHFMAACHGVGIDNLLIEIDGPEMPIMDGSSLGFCDLFKSAGIRGQDKLRQVIRILKPVKVAIGDATASLIPSELDVLSLSARIDFDGCAIGTQQASFVLTPGTFCQELSHARTFGQSSELAELHKQGLALGGSLDNAILVDGDNIVNPDGLRCADEFIRHKLLDAVGDLALAGAGIAGHYEALRPGHRLNIRLLRTLLARTDAWCWEPLSDGVGDFQPNQTHADAALPLRA